jgi:hypothetical protein
MTADKFITPASLERVSLADAYFHFVATSPSERQAAMDLSAAIRAEQLGELLAEKVTELRSGDTQPRTTLRVSIPTEAPADRTGMFFDWESSKAMWKNGESHFTFEGINVARDRVLAVQPAPAHATEPKRQRSGGRSPTFDWDVVFAQTLAPRRARLARHQEQPRVCEANLRRVRERRYGTNSRREYGAGKAFDLA